MPDTDLSKEIIRLRELFKKKNYFELILRGVQLMADSSDEILESWHDVVNEPYGEDKDFSAVAEIYDNTIRKMSGDNAPKAKAMSIFMEIVSQMGFKSYTRRQVVSIMHKIERVVSYRNDLAHSYYKKNLLKNMKSRAEECLAVLEEIENCGKNVLYVIE